MIIALALVAACFAGARGQSNSEYQFRQQSVADGDSWGPTGATDPVPVLSMDCLAANAYGQWTLSSTANGASYPAGWYLLANGLYRPSLKFEPATNHPTCIPPGVVQSAALAGGVVPTEPKATANLDGAVSYVWPDATTTRTFFAVHGFASTDVDISLSFCSNPAPPMNVVTAPAPHVFPLVKTWTGTPTNTHTVVTALPYQDEFDVASDARYLYIAWCSTENFSLGITTNEIWVTVVDLATQTTLPTWPRSAGQGVRPTISCDPRQNRNGGTTPAFDVAYISALPTSGMVRWFTWDNGSGAFNPRPVVNQFRMPGTGALQAYGFVNHLRVLVSSVPGSLAAHHALYANVDFDGGTLILYNEDNPNLPIGFAAYVEGDLLSPASPIPPSGNPSAPGWPILDKPIAAFANPYDNGDNSTDPIPTWREFDQFHCVYQTTPPAFSPLEIVRGSDNGVTHPAPIDPLAADTRLTLTQDASHVLIPDPVTNYVAAVNQMGIHVHWRTSTNMHYYARDLNRAFDEDIEENTLVTDQCTVTDGTAHGGAVGAAVKGFGVMSVWTDPNYGPPSADGLSGLYSPRALGLHNEHVGELQFVGDGVKLTVGSAVNEPCNGGLTLPPCNATLAVMPFFYFDFLGTNQGVTVNPTSTFDYYGLYATHNSSGIQTGSGTPFTDGTGDGAGTGTIDLEGASGMPAILNVHGGTDFNVGPNDAGTVQATWTQYGDNNIYQGTGPAATLIAGASNTILRDASNNYWGGQDPNTHSATYWPNFNYTLTSGTNFLTSASSYTFPLDCGAPFSHDTTGLQFPVGRVVPLSITADTVWDSCDLAGGWGEIWDGQQQWLLCYDTMHWYLQHCYELAGYDQAWQTFGSAAGQRTMHGSDSNGFMTQDSLYQLRSWLLSERFLNPADGWYCDCISVLAAVWPGSAPAELSILKFLIDNPRCGKDPSWSRAYDMTRHGQVSAWYGTVWARDTTAKFDSTLPSLHDLGLDSLLQDAAAGVSFEALGPQIIADAHVLANPFPNETSISLTINREAYLHIELFDLLGNRVQKAGFEGIFESGQRVVPLGMSSQPPGTYYLRISTANNEVRTIKLVKE
ncbi:MAG: T9SS type A sorting domain-containing protein [Bacteroidota bacterium]|nr:T9SS type A sorting domain-containing protein [Bacteroidota bacterium]MDP4232071.1 T9SS type A sorting domain-containing protein [Bacteroidota bacterium]MDP4241222.1 T9SS type A sorting domain-containing protein [Bacteroidota bacterium]MDP4286614.1 T9SS type A sorting domain-containing protein [Bacteroidota bacterium]